MHLMRIIVTKRRAVALLGAGLLALSACGTSTDGGGSGSGTSGSDAGGEAAPTTERTEVGALTPRIVLAHEGGVTTLDSADGSTLDATELEGYVRLNPAGDGRHVAVSASDAVTMYDTGLLVQGHGDHFHYYVQDPALTDLSVEAPHPGHVVPHGESTAIFADGTGEITVIDPATLGDGELDVLRETATDAPHHGVAVPLPDGGLLTTRAPRTPAAPCRSWTPTGTSSPRPTTAPACTARPPRSPPSPATSSRWAARTAR